MILSGSVFPILALPTHHRTPIIHDTTLGWSGMAAPPSTVALILCTLMMSGADATWCVARSDASDQVLQRALDYACGSGADCAPILSDGLCFLPNTILAHASYAFNSFYQRKAMAPGSCDFAGTATVAKTDPSYGSCVYPSSPSTAGGTGTQGGGSTGGTTMTPPALYPPPPPATSTTPFPDNGVGPEVPGQPNSGGSQEILAAVCLFCASFAVYLTSPVGW